MLSPEGAFCLPGFASREKLWGLGDATEARLGAAIATLFLLVLAAPRLHWPFATGRAPTRVVARADFLDPWVPVQLPVGAAARRAALHRLQALQPGFQVVQPRRACLALDSALDIGTAFEADE